MASQSPAFRSRAAWSNRRDEYAVSATTATATTTATSTGDNDGDTTTATTNDANGDSAGDFHANLVRAARIGGAAIERLVARVSG